MDMLVVSSPLCRLVGLRFPDLPKRSPKLGRGACSTAELCTGSRELKGRGLDLRRGGVGLGGRSSASD